MADNILVFPAAPRPKTPDENRRDAIKSLDEVTEGLSQTAMALLVLQGVDREAVSLAAVKMAAALAILRRALLSYRDPGDENTGAAS